MAGKQAIASFLDGDQPFSAYAADRPAGGKLDLGGFLDGDQPLSAYRAGALAKAQDEGDSEFWKGFGSYLLKQGPEAVASTVQAGGILLGNDWIEKDLAPRIRGLADADEAKYAPRVGTLERVRWNQIGTNPGAVIDDVADWAMYALGNGLASTLPSIVGGVTGGFVGGAAGSVVGPGGTAVGGTVGAIGGAASTSYVQNTGPLFDELVAEGMAPKDAALWAAGGGVVLAGLDAFYPAKVALNLGKGAQQEVRRKLVERILKEAGKGALQEGVTEAAQEAVQTGIVAAGTGKDVDWREASLRMANAFAAGALPGAAIGGVAGIQPDRAPPSPKPTPGPAGGAPSSSGAPAGGPSPAAPSPDASIAAPVAPRPADEPPEADTEVMPETGEDLAAEADNVAYLTDLATKGGAPGPGVSVTLLDPEDGGEIFTGTVEAYVGAPDDISIRVVDDRGQARELPLREVGLRRNDMPQQPATPDPVSRETDQPVTVRPAAPAPGAPIPAPPATEAPAAATPPAVPEGTGNLVSPLESPLDQDVGTPKAPAPITGAEDLEKLEAVRQRVEPEPTDGQKEAGNYRKGHLKFKGLDITIENPKGSVRSGTDAGGKPWSVEMPVDYGYVKRTEGADGDQVDVFLGPSLDSDNVYVIDQRDLETGEFDEHKVMLGFDLPIEAKQAYARSFSDRKGRDRVMRFRAMTMDEFRAELAEGLARPDEPKATWKKANIVPTRDGYMAVPQDRDGMPTGPRVVVNRVGADGKTETERKASEAVRDAESIRRGELPVEDDRERQRQEKLAEAAKNPPPWFTERTSEGRRQLAEAAGMSQAEAAGVAKLNWPNLLRRPEMVNRLAAAAKAEEGQKSAVSTPVTSASDNATITGKEASDGLQGAVSSGDAPEGAGDVQRAPAQREPGRAPGREKRRGAQDADRGPGERTEASERRAEGPRGQEPGRAERPGDADRLPERKPRAERTPGADGVKGENFRIDTGALKEDRGWKQKALDNIRAIELMREIEAEGRPATRDEQQQLALYVGWGGIRGAFPDSSGEFQKGFAEIGKKLQDLLSPEEYATARRSIQYAHYTSETIVRAMWQAARRLGFEGGKVFEPGMGVGNFAGMMPPDLAEASVYNGLELDHTTARIARLLYPKWGVRQDDFTKAPVPKDTYDLVIGNPPFADIAIKSDPAYAKHGFLLHDYFFAKSLDAVRPGGLLAFISSAGTMNKIDTKAREYLADRADLVGAIRLPGDAFEKNAGTSVTTDIIILRKRLPGEQPGDSSWVQTGEQTLPTKDGGEKTGAVNRFFIDHPDMVLGEPGFFDKLYPGRYGVRSDGRDLGKALQQAIERLQEGVMSERQTPQDRAEVDFAIGERKEGSFYLGKDGALMQVRNGVGHAVERRGKGVGGGMTAAAMERVKGLIPVRDALRAVYAADLDEDTANAEKARKRLNEAYDAFVAKFGPINKAEISYRRPTVIQQEIAREEAREEARFAGQPWDEGSFDPTPLIEKGAGRPEIARARREAKEAAAKAGQPWNEGTFDPDDMPDVVIDKRPNIEPFMDDPESYRLRAIEHYNDDSGEAQKSAVFFENVITRERAPEIKSVGDALLWVLNKRGRVELTEIAISAGVSESEALEQLGDAIFKVPGTGVWQTREQYLSGNVRQKLRQARAAAERNAEFRRNVSALEAVQPALLPPSEINANLGMPWLPPAVIEQFGQSLGLERLKVGYLPKLAQWTVSGDERSAAAVSTWGTSDRSAPALISDALNRTDPKIYDTVTVDGKKTQVLNAEATQAAQDKLREIKEKFSEWVWSDPERASELAALYNEEYNNLVVPEYDGSYLTTPGIAAHWSWRPHQKRAIARIIQSGNTYLAHAVGAGKTSEMIGAGMEMRRLGLVKKPMYVVPNHMLGQFTKEFYEQYPTARIAVADERQFHTHRRKQFVANVANEDLDAVIITHSAFGLIPVSDRFQNNLIQRQIADFRSLLSEIDKKDSEQRFTRRRIENAIERLEQRLVGKKGRKDQVFTFEEMGVDFLFVDEAHLFRKLDFATKMSNVKGISPEGSKASFDLYVKTRYLETVNPGRNLVLASGTPVTNTMAELFSVSRYLQERELDARGLGQFDAWAGAFGDTVTQLEQDPAGGYKPVTRFAKFVNVPELSAMVRQVMDVVTSRQLDQYVTRPKLKGGKRQMNLAEKSELLEEYQADLARRMEAIAKRKGPPKPGDDIILNVINDGRHAAIDMRLVDPNLPNDPGSKLNLLIDNVFRIWKETKRQAFHRPEDGGFSAKPVDYGPAAQMIFSNLGVGGSRDFNVHRYIVTELARRGVPMDEIAQISEYKTHVAKQRLFNDMNEGKKRVLIGSTARMATGVNAQRRLYALHNLDPLWYPADDEQRNGRIIRQGNMNPEVEIHDYSTKGTYDSTMWGLMETKARFIQGFFEGDPSLRDMEDLGEASQYEQAKAITTADPRLIELTDLKQKLERARRRRTAFEREMYSIRETVKSAQRSIAHAEKRIPQIEEDIARRQDTKGDAFKGKVGKAAYTDRAEFGNALLGEIELLLAAETERSDVKLGELGGFDVKVDVIHAKWLDGQPWEPEVYIARAGDFDTTVSFKGSARGLVQSLENALRAFDDDLAHYRKQVAEGKKTIEDFTPQLDKTFQGDDEIRDLARQVHQIESALAAEAAAVQRATEAAAPAQPVEEAMEDAPSDLDDDVRYAMASAADRDALRAIRALPLAETKADLLRILRESVAAGRLSDAALSSIQRVIDHMPANPAANMRIAIEKGMSRATREALDVSRIGSMFLSGMVDTTWTGSDRVLYVRDQGAGTARTFIHENAHLIYDAMMTDAEIARARAIFDGIRGPSRQAAFTSGYGLNADTRFEEWFAESVADYYAGKLNLPGVPATDRAFIDRMIDRIWKVLVDIFSNEKAEFDAFFAEVERALAGQTYVRYAMSAIRRQGIPRAADPPISSHQNMNPVKPHKDYAAAKAGDIRAAVRLVQDLTTEASRTSVRERFGPKTIFVPVRAQEATGDNAIPLALAKFYAAEVGAETALDILQVNKAYHTGAKAAERLIARAIFDGPVKAGAEYVLVDDVTTMGGTLAELADHIQAQGGKVAGVITLVNSSRTPTLAAPAQRVREIERRYGDAVREAFGLEPASLTAAEAFYILNFRDADSLRARAAAAQRERDERLLRRGVRKEEDDGRLAAVDIAADQIGGLMAPEAFGPVIEAFRTELRRIVPAARVAAVPRLFMSSPSAAEASGAAPGQAVAAAYGQGLIALAYETVGRAPSSGRSYARHEAIHALRDLRFFTDREWRLLEAESRRRWISEHGLPNRPNDPRVVEEGIAYAFQSWRPGDRSQTGPVTRLFRKLRTFLVRLVNALKGRGFQTVDDVFQRIAGGEVGQRGLADIADSEALVGEAMQVAEADLEKIDNAIEPPRYAMADLRERAAGMAGKLRGDLPLAPNVGLEAPEIERDLNPLKRPFFIPASLFKDWPALAAAVDRWSRRQAALQSSLTRTQREWDQATRRLSAGEMETLTAILFRGDALGEVYSAEDLANLVDENGEPIEISSQVAEAYRDSRRILDKLGNLVDQHERAMRNFLRRRIKPTLIRRIARSSPLSAEEASTLLTKRYALRSRLHSGNGDPEVLGRRIEVIERQLGYERGAEDPVSQAIDQLDIVDRTLNRTSIKRRDADGNVIEGYVPHKFFGSWAVYRLVEDEDADGKPFLRRELVADYAEHGFHASRNDAITAANRYAGENPHEMIVVRPVAMRFAGASAATLPGPTYQTLIARLSDTLEVGPEELRETLSETVRPRSKRRWAGFKQKRQGIAGYSRDLDRVMRAHVGEVMRYVYLDKVKYEAITLEESLRLEEGSRRRPQLGAAWRAYVRDVLSERQPLEKVLDSLFDKPWLQPLQVGLGGGLATFALAGGISGNPFVGLLLGSWVGYRFYQSRKSAGEMGGFYSRGLTGELLNTTAHLKLGAVFNLFSALVNVTQIALNTASVLPYRYVAYGVGEAMKTVSGVSDRWVRILDRHNIDPVFKHSEVSPHIYDKPSRLAQLSMIAFDTVEKVNRSATFIGAYKQALDGNAPGVPADNAGAAQRYAMRVVNRTQFDYSNAMKPEALRNVFLRVPLQFKNFIAQQIAFVAGLQSKAEVGKFLLHMFLLTGILGLPGLQFIDWLVNLLLGVSPINEVKRIALEMQAEGAFVGTMVDGLARGFPALFGIDISSRAGMGERFLPSLQVSDLIGPMPSTIVKARELAENEAGIVDQLRNLSTGLGAPLKALESAANGMPVTTLLTEPSAFLAALGDDKVVVTNPRKKLRPEVQGDGLSNIDLAMMAVGGSPIDMTRIYDFAAVARFEDERLDRLSNRYMNRIAQAYRTYMPHNAEAFRAEVGRLRIEARDEEGLLISTQAIRRLLRDMQQDRTLRTIKQYRRQQRPELIRLAEGMRTN